MEDSEFTRLALQTIALLADAIEGEDQDCRIDVDFQGDVLNITTDQGIFVINKHSAAKEIWLSSPISGPHHFYYISGRWKSKTANNLIIILQQELKINLELYFGNDGSVITSL